MTVESVLWAGLGISGTVIVNLYHRLNRIDQRREKEAEDLTIRLHELAEAHLRCEKNFAELHGRMAAMELLTCNKAGTCPAWSTLSELQFKEVLEKVKQSGS